VALLVGLGRALADPFGPGETDDLDLRRSRSVADLHDGRIGDLLGGAEVAVLLVVGLFRLAGEGGGNGQSEVEPGGGEGEFHVRLPIPGWTFSTWAGAPEDRAEAPLIKDLRAV